MITIEERFAPKGSKCRPQYNLMPTYITIHETGNRNSRAGAINHANYLQNGGKDYTTSWHYAVDSERATQSIPCDEVAWHAGDGAQGDGNRKSIAIEICVNPESDFTGAVAKTSELVKSLMVLYNIPIANVVQHNHWSGKNCPETLRENNNEMWDDFIASLKQPTLDAELYRVQVGAFSSYQNAVDYSKKLNLMDIEAFVKE